MAEAAQKALHTPTTKAPSKSGYNIADEQRSGELVISFAGAIGCGINDAVKVLGEQLINAGYEIQEIKVSDILKRLYKSGKVNLPTATKDCDALEGAERYTFLQDCGNKVREEYHSSILADAVISEIAAIRKALATQENKTSEEYKRRAYIVNQLKHPDEVKTLRLIYGESFFLVGVLSSTDDRLKNLRVDDRIKDEEEARSLIKRDKEENQNYGQKLQKTLYNADYFIRHTNSDEKALNRPVERFVHLIHGLPGETPTLQEIGMFEAYTASLSSACLSRQVGAAIADEEGTIISTGCNDAPASGGGLYTADHNPDLRCHRNGGFCHNHQKQDELLKDITQLIEAHEIEKAVAEKIAKSIKKNTRVSSLTEFSRAIHAEMDAILKVARRDSTSTKNCTLYTTTYPCHNCARHIVAAGMKKVVYIEPYEKSLALELHNDSITTSERNANVADGSDKKKLIIVQFEGTSPTRYESFFKYKKGTKVDGKLHKIPLRESTQIDPLFTEAYHRIEKRILKNYKETISGNTPPIDSPPAA